MGRLRYFRIKLENNDSGIYFGGDTVQGKLLVGLEGDGKKARGRFTYKVYFIIKRDIWLLLDSLLKEIIHDIPNL